MIDLILESPKLCEMCTCSVNSPIACSFVAFGGNLKAPFLRMSGLLV